MWDPTEIREGIKQLEQRKNIVVRPVNKGGAIVILSKEAHKNEINKQLKDSQTYKLLNNPTLIYEKVPDKLVNKGKRKGYLNEKEAKYLVPNTCHIPVKFIYCQKFK